MPPPGGLTRPVRLLLVAAPFLLALSVPAPLEAQKEAEKRQAQSSPCPNIALCCHASLKQGLLGPFTATLGDTGGVKPSLNWKLSAGQIARGQGTQEILIDTKGLKGGAVIATLEVGGFGPRCSATCVAELPEAPGGSDSRQTRLATLSVSVKSAHDGRPVPRAKINVYRDDGAFGGQAETDARGFYASGGWKPGTYRVEVFADRFERQESKVTLDSSSAGAVSLSLKPVAAPPTPTPTSSPTPSPTPTATPSPSPAATPSSESPGLVTTPAATATPIATPSPTPSPWTLIFGTTDGTPWIVLAALAALAAAGYLLSRKLAGGAAAGAGGTVATPSEGPAAAAGTTKQSDKVHCTVFAPPAARPGDMLKVQVFAHLKEQAGQLAGLAAERDDEARKGGSEAIKGEIERGKELTFKLTMPGLEVKEEERSLTWEGEPDSVRFTVTVPEDSKPKTIWGTVEILYESVPVGEVEFKFKVADDAAEVAPAAAPPPAEQKEIVYEKAFISYSRKDDLLVLEKVQMLEAQGIECFLDTMSFRPGEEWRQMITHYIDRSDVFFLFWSSAAKASEEVGKEWKYALERSRSDQLGRPRLKPIPIEGPPVVPPPPELSHLHFDDRYRYFIKAKKAARRPPAQV